MESLAAKTQRTPKKSPSVRPSAVLAEFPIPFAHFSTRTKHAGGRPTKLTDELLVELECLVALTPIGKKHLCTLLDITHQTCRNWELQGEADRRQGQETPHTEFLDLFEKGGAYWRARLMHAQLTGDNTWPKYATALERLWPDEFGKRNEDNGAPKVAVFIGAGEDVKVLIANVEAKALPQSALGAPFACSTQPLSEPLHRLTDETS